MARVEGLPAALLSLALLSACAPANETPKPIAQGRTVLATATTVPCDPEKYAASLGITPVPVGGGAAPEEMVLISRKLGVCESLSDAEKDAFIKFGIAHPLLATPDPVRQLIPTRTTEPTPIPEPKLSFPDFAVYYGKTAEGLEVLLAAKPDGKLVFTARMDKITCSDPRIKPINGLLAFQRETAVFDFKTKSGSRIINGRLVKPDTVVGQVGNNIYVTGFDVQNINCPETLFNYTATQTGTGKDAFVDRYLKMWNETLSPQVQRSLDSYLH